MKYSPKHLVIKNLPYFITLFRKVRNQNLHEADLFFRLGVIILVFLFAGCDETTRKGLN